MRTPIALLLAMAACNPAPSEEDLASVGQVGYRNGDDPDDPANSGERGTIKISEINWAGSRTNDGTWNRDDFFVELRNEGARPMNLSGWILELDGAVQRTWRIPTSDKVLDVGEHAFIARRTDGCFPEPDWVLPDLELPFGDSIELTLLDADERLMEPVGSKDAPPFAGGDDGVQTRSMERLEIMFGGYGTEANAWHYYTALTVPVTTDQTVNAANNDRIASSCQQNTLASPGRSNSPDYSGAFASGSFD